MFLSRLLFTATPSVYIPDILGTLHLNCTFTAYPNNPDLVELTSMIISRGVINNGVQEFEELNDKDFSFSNMRPNEATNGLIQDISYESHVTLIIHNATLDQITAYECKVYALDVLGIPESVRAQVTVIESKRTCTISELIELEQRVQDLTHDYQCAKDELDNCRTSLPLTTVRLLFLKNFFIQCEDRNGTRYYLYDRQFPDVDFGEAICEGLGGYMAEINDEDEYNFVVNFPGPFQNITLPKYFNSIYLGARDWDAEGQWYFRYSGNPVTFFMWSHEEPNGEMNENCMVIWGVTRMGDNPCTPYPHLLTSFLCEILPVHVPKYDTKNCVLP